MLLINASNGVICSPADPCLFVKWANLPLLFKEATTKNSKQWQSARNCDWLGLGRCAPGHFQPHLQTLHHLLFSCSYWYVISFLLSVCKFKTTHAEEQKKNKRTQFVIYSPSLLYSKRAYISASLWFIFGTIFFFKLKSDILFVMPPRGPAVTSLQCLHSRYYFWLSVLHLGAQWSLFHFLCHNAIAQISLRGITLLEKRITYVVSQTHPSSPYPTGADDQWVCQCQGLRTKREDKRRRRVFWKHVT